MSTIVQEHPVLSLEPLGHDVALKDYNHITVQEIAVPDVHSPSVPSSPDAAAAAAAAAVFATSAASTSSASEPSCAGSSAGSQTSACESCADDLQQPLAEPLLSAPRSAEPFTPPPPPPQTHNALVVTADGGYQLVADFPVPTPTLGPDEVMIRNKATGLNHIDWMSVEYNFCLPALPWVTGREMAGVVEAVGAAVTDVKAGDAVWTTTYYKDRRAGCFQDLVVVPQHTVFPIPPTLDFHSAACLGVAGITAAMTLWQWLGVPMVDPPAQEKQQERQQGEQQQQQTEAQQAEAQQAQTAQDAPAPSSPPPATAAAAEKEVILVWGGSTVTGQFAIQLAAQAGLEVVAVCSAATAALVRSRGAAHVVTYTGKTDMHVIGEVLCAAGGRLTRAVDLVGARTARLVLQIIAASGRPAAAPVAFAPLAFMSAKDAVPANARVHTVEIKQFVLDRASHVYGRRLNELVAAGRVQLPAVRVLGGGLDAVAQGLAMVKEGNLEGRKLVISFGE